MVFPRRPSYVTGDYPEFLRSLLELIGQHRKRTIPDDRELRRAGAQPQLGTGSGYQIPARYRFLQAADAAVYLEALPQDACVILSVQPNFVGASRRHVRTRGTRRADGARPRAAVSKI